MTDAKQGNQKSILDYRTLEVLADLADDTKSVAVEIVRGNCPSVRSLQISQFPPVPLHQNNVPVRFTVEIENRTFPINLMISLVKNNDGRITVLGFVAHEQIAGFRKYPDGKVIETEHFLVAVEYSQVNRAGLVHLYKDLYEFIKTL